MSSDQRNKLLVILFFAAFLCLGIFIFDDYGISGDEIVNRNNGLLTYRYVFEDNKDLLTYRDRYYGTVFELPLILVEKEMAIEDSRTIFYMRHLATFLLFYVGVIFFYLLCRYHFKSRKMGILGSLFLILSPRIFAHSFYNSKDIALLALFIISLYTLVRFLDEKTLSRAALHALSCALVIDVRITGMIIPFITFVFFFTDLLADNKTERKGPIVSFIAYAVLLPVLVVFFWPILWSGPVARFTEAFRYMRRYPWDGTVLYMGEYVKAMDLSWNYIPGWIFVTTPALYGISFFAGMIVLLRSLAGGIWRFFSDRRNELVFLAALLVPLIAVIALKAVLYDGWRQMFFIYPAFLMLSLTGLRSIYGFTGSRFGGPLGGILRSLIIAVVCACFFSTAFIMWKLHPYQNVYFNFLAGDMTEAKNNFEMDYWGLSYTEALEYIAENDNDDIVNIYVSSLPGRIGRIPALILDAEDSRRFRFTDTPEGAKYFVSNYRWHPGEYPYKNEVFSVEKGGAKIVVVYKLM